MKENRRYNLLLLIFIAFGIGKTYSQNTLFTDVYVNAYFSLNQEKFAPFLDENVIWSDPTWSEVDPNNKPVVGKQNVLVHLEKATEGVSNMKYEIDHRFQSKDLYVYEGTLNYSWTNPNGKTFNFSIREVTILKVKDKKVNEHSDYGDFKTWIQQYQNQMK